MRDFINKPQDYYDAIEEDRLGQIRLAIEENDIIDYSELMQYAAECFLEKLSFKYWNMWSSIGLYRKEET